MKREHPLLFTSAVLLAALIGCLYLLHRRGLEIADLKGALSRAETGRAVVERQLAQRRREIRQLRESARPAALPSESSFEDALDVWLGNVHRLSEYLQRHPEWRIPQMDLLTAFDWLDVTKDLRFDSEAGLRKALGRLRELARQKVAPLVDAALRKAMAANGGRLPSDPRELAAYLPADFNLAILQQLDLNQSGKITGLRTPVPFYVVDKPVDLWDGVGFYGPEGCGFKASHADGEDQVINAMNAFEKSTGAAPTDPSQLMPYKGIAAMDPARLGELFAALTTKPAP